MWMWALLGIGGVLWPVSRIPRIEAIAHVADLAALVPSAGLGALLIASALPLRPARSAASTWVRRNRTVRCTRMAAFGKGVRNLGTATERPYRCTLDMTVSTGGP